ncbi:50S ribosome-binding GTPase [Lachnospiraceae bacterium YSD2013]|nr:50S ribosome-binding GTPase [Lachnospiraceae bacterium YSD2013]
MSDVTFLAAEYADRIEESKKEILSLYKQNGHEDKADKLEKELSDIKEEDRIRLVFIGQYTAGKSTIISALTGDNSIKIDTDISTEVTKDYAWANVVLTDTPGLYTGYTEHDQRTIEMIKRSDLLIFCITSDLFNPCTLEDFKHWAFEYNYAGKMFLLINKMSNETGDYDSLCHNYKDSINKSLHPHSIEEFTHAFLDAKDYKIGKRDNDVELVEFSHFEGFVNDLNDFIRLKGKIGKFDTPIMIMKNSIDNTLEDLADDESNKEYSALLSRIEKAVGSVRRKLSAEANALIQRLLKPIIDKGYEVSSKIGLEEIDYSDDDVQNLVKACCESLNAELNTLCQRGIEALQKEIEGILDSDLARYFFESIKDVNEKPSIFEGSGQKAKRVQFDSINDIAQKITGGTVNLATKGAGTAGYFIKASEASGSQLHKLVLNIGHKFGVKFVPWQAANITKLIGNVAKVLGPVLNVVTVLIDVKDSVQESAEERKAFEARIGCRKAFSDIERDVEKQYIEELNNIFTVFDDVTNQVQEDREKVNKIIMKDSKMARKLLDIRRNLTDIQKEIL